MLNSEVFFSYLTLSNPWIVGLVLNCILGAIAIVAPKKLLTPAGLLHGCLLGVLIWGCLGWQGYAVVMFYFLIGSGVTRIGMAEKEAAGIAEKRSGARGPENVRGSALTATFCALGLFLLNTGWVSLSSIPSAQSLLLLGYVASFSTKLSDTCASEIGKAYGKRTFLITTLQPVPRGVEGAISLEGTLAGAIGSLLIAFLGYTVGMIDLMGILWCIIAAFIATNFESFIGATIQEKFDWLTNELVNIINTSVGAIVAIFLAFLHHFLTRH